jgi:hypothetical protein
VGQTIVFCRLPAVFSCSFVRPAHGYLVCRVGTRAGAWRLLSVHKRDGTPGSFVLAVGMFFIGCAALQIPRTVC